MSALFNRISHKCLYCLLGYLTNVCTALLGYLINVCTVLLGYLTNVCIV